MDHRNLLFVHKAVSVHIGIVAVLFHLFLTLALYGVNDEPPAAAT